MAGREHRLGALLDPLHRGADLARRRGCDELLGIGVQLGAEPAADVGRDRPHLGLAHAADDRQERPQEVRHLGRAVHDELVGGRVPVGDDAARLDRDVDQPLVSDRVLDDDLGVGERLVDAVGLVGEDERDVRVELLVDLRRPVGQRRLGRDDRGKRVVRHLDRSRGVGRRVAVGRDHDRDGLARVAHAALRQRRAHRVHHVAGRVRGARHAGRELEVVARQDRHDARHRLGL
jgi:hypothetical protein